MLAVVAAVLAMSYIARHAWLPAVVHPLTCQASDERSDAILVDLVEYHVDLFDRVKALQSAGSGPAVLVPVLKSIENEKNFSVALGFVDVLCRASRIDKCETFPAALAEPYSLSLARASADELKRRGLSTVTLVTSGFRSRRAAAIYGRVLSGAGIQMRCQPVFFHRGPADWYRTTHGIQDVVLQAGKLLYYYLLVLPRA